MVKMKNFPDFEFEKSLVDSGTRYLLGVDEVGRGPWAGPVSVGVFVIDLRNFRPNEFVKMGVADSKKVSPKNREKIYKNLKKSGFLFEVFSADSKEIDQKGIGKATKDLITTGVKKYRREGMSVLVDGNYKLEIDAYQSIIKGDSKCFSIAAASIVAKVTRDRVMVDFGVIYPEYGFAEHKGYGTKKHADALKIYGPCPIHRQSFKPIKLLQK